MYNLFDEKSSKEILDRLEKITPSSERKWGAMDAAQMLAHCCMVLDMGMGRHNPPRRMIGRIMGRFFRHHYINSEPFKRGNPTDPDFVITGSKSFDTEKDNLRRKINHFLQGGIAGITKSPHPFFGHFTPEEWAAGMYKHLDHHFRQFGC